jgi:hypothetical protein
VLALQLKLTIKLNSGTSLWVCVRDFCTAIPSLVAYISVVVTQASVGTCLLESVNVYQLELRAQTEQARVGLVIQVPAPLAQLVAQIQLRVATGRST